MSGYILHVRLRFLFLCGCLSWIAGCAGLRPPSELRPAAHPLLSGWRLGGTVQRGAVLETARTAPGEAASSESDGDDRARVARQLDALLGARTIGGAAATDTALLQAAFEGTGFSSRARRIGRGGDLRAEGATTRTPRIGDLILFRAGGRAPKWAVTRSVKGTVVHAVAVTRGAARMIRIDRSRPNRRRKGTTIINSFVRPITKRDKAGTAYLAGQLFDGARDVLR